MRAVIEYSRKGRWYWRPGGCRRRRCNRSGGGSSRSWGGGWRRVGLGSGALIGDQLQGQETKQAEQQKALDQQRAEIAKNQALIDALKKRNLEARETSRGVMVNLPSVNFQFDSAELTPDGRGRVDQIASIVRREAANRRIAVEGHASRESAPKKCITNDSPKGERIL